MANPYVQVQGTRELRAAIKQVDKKCDDLKAANLKAAKFVLDAARDRMPRKSGDLTGSYYAKGLQTGGVVGSKLRYAGVSEFGGSIPNRGSAGGVGFRHQRNTAGLSLASRARSAGRHIHKPTARSQALDSYYVYPAFKENAREIRENYQDEIERLHHKYLGDH